MERTAVCQFEVLRKRCDRIDNSITLVSIRQDWEHGLVRECVHNASHLKTPRAKRTDEYSTADWAQTFPSAYVNY